METWPRGALLPGIRRRRLVVIAPKVRCVPKVRTKEFAGAGAEPPPIYWLRYNPHEWHVDGVLCTVPKAEPTEKNHQQK